MINELNLTLDEVTEIIKKFSENHYHISNEIVIKLKPLHIELKRLDDIQNIKNQIIRLKSYIKQYEKKLLELETISDKRDQKINEILK